MRHLCQIQQTRHVSDFGETLVVRAINGFNALVDPCCEATAVQVPAGRRAKIVRFSLLGLPGRDADMLVIRDCFGLGFVSARYPSYRVYLGQLRPGQLVDILPSAEPAAAYAALIRPLPVLRGAVAAQPVYAALAA